MFMFPEIKTTRSNEEQASKINDEVGEFELAIRYKDLTEVDKEAIDVWHAAETFIRVHFRGRERMLKDLIEQTIAKNTARGYYAEKCY